MILYNMHSSIEDLDLIKSYYEKRLSDAKKDLLAFVLMEIIMFSMMFIMLFKHMSKSIFPIFYIAIVFTSISLFQSNNKVNEFKYEISKIERIINIKLESKKN